MDSLPTDILRHIITFLLRTEMTRLMLCSKQFYLHVRGALYASLDLKLTPFSLNRNINLLRILSSSGSIQARCVRHLSVHGLALTSHETQASLSQALIQAVGLLSLEISLKTRPASIAGQIFTDELCHSPEFLPQLVALKADDVEVVHALVPQRPIHSVFLEDTVPASMVTPFLNALASSTSAITQLQVRLEVHDNASVVDLAHKVASTFPKLSVLCIEVFLLQPAEKPLSWKSMKVSGLLITRRNGTLSAYTGYIARNGSSTRRFVPTPYVQLYRLP